MKRIKLKFLETFLLSLLAVFAPIKAMVIITGVLILSDTLTGVIAAHKKNQKITSAGLRRTITKSCVYLAALCLGFLVEKYMIDGLMPISKIVAGLISMVEFKSILENLDVINGSSLFKKLIEKLGSINDHVSKTALEPISEEKKDEEPKA